MLVEMLMIIEDKMLKIIYLLQHFIQSLKCITAKKNFCLKSYYIETLNFSYPSYAYI